LQPARGSVTGFGGGVLHSVIRVSTGSHRLWQLHEAHLTINCK